MTYSDPWMKKAKWLTQALILSGTLNIGLLTTFIYFVLKEKHTAVAFDLKPAPEKESKIGSALTNKSLFWAYSTLSFQELLLRLEDKDLVEDGYTKRDLALSCLVNFHYFNLDRALGGLLLQKRYIKLANEEGGEEIDLTIFPGLADYQFQAILQYAKTEKWPFTSEGLFYELKRAPVKDPSLLEAFYLTPEFHAVHTLFVRGGLKVSKEEIATLLVDGDFTTLEAFTNEQKKAQDLSPEKLKSFLVHFLTLNSKTAAKWLLDLDMEFVCKRLDDPQTVLMLSLISEKTASLEHFAKELLVSPRSDLIWKKAASVLYAFSNENLPEPYDHNAALARFIPHRLTPKKVEEAAQVIPVKKPPVIVPLKKEKPSAPLKKVKETPSKKEVAPKRFHTVQEGDNLWKIARKYKVSVEAIMKLNHLESNKLRTGRKLEIPPSSKA